MMCMSYIVLTVWRNFHPVLKRKRDGGCEILEMSA
jgi:hypothetical protein